MLRPPLYISDDKSSPLNSNKSESFISSNFLLRDNPVDVEHLFDLKLVNKDGKKHIPKQFCCHFLLLHKTTGACYCTRKQNAS